MKFNSILAFSCGAFLPVINLQYESFEVQISIYKFVIPLLIAIIVGSTKSVNHKVVARFTAFILFATFVTTYALVDLLINNVLTDMELNRVLYHKVTQFIVVLAYTTTFVFIVTASIKPNFLASIVKGYIISLAGHLILALLIYYLNVAGILQEEISNQVGLYKMKGILGEPKQAAAALFSGFLLLRFSLKGSEVLVFCKKTSNRLQIFFLLGSLATLATSFFINILLLLIIAPFMNRQIVSKAIMATVVCFAFLVIYFKNPCEMVRQPEALLQGIDSILAKVNSIQNILSYLPKDGIIVVDAVCSPVQYILGQGAGSLYHKLLRGDLTNPEWYQTIGIFKTIVDREPHSTEGPSTLQIQLLTDYGVIGTLLFLIFITSVERALMNKKKRSPLILVYLFIFVNTQIYLWFLILIYIMILKMQNMRLNSNLTNEDHENIYSNTFIQSR